MQCRPPPALSLRSEGGALCNCPDTQAIALRIVHRTGIDRRAATAAEGVKAFVAAFGRLDIGLGCAAQQHEMLGRCRNIDAKRGSGERLTIGAVADVERVGVDLRFEGDLAAMAVSVDLHASGSVRVAPCKRVELSRLRWRRRQSLASSHVPSLAWWPVTAAAKRRQGGCRPECQ